MGFDNFAKLDQWFEWKKLLNLLTTIYVLSRQDQLFMKEKMLSLIGTEAPSLTVSFLGSHPFEYLSSTKLRSQGLKDNA